jgi:hypothetical protein
MIDERRPQAGVSPLSRSGVRWLILLVIAGALIRVLIATLLVHDSFDFETYRNLDQTLRTTPGAVFNSGIWPYPGLYFPVIMIAASLESLTSVDISVWVKILPILADLGIAWLVQSYLGMRGASEGKRLAAAAAVLLGPSFFMISGYVGHIDSLAFLPVVFAMYAWRRWPDLRHREAMAAALIGIGASLKTVPLLMVLAFLPEIPSWARRIRFGVLSVVIPFLVLVPWLLVNPDSVKNLNYSGFPGAGGLSLALQPSLPEVFLTGEAGAYNTAIEKLNDYGTPILLVILGVLGLYLIFKRVSVERSAVLLWLAVFVFLPSFFFQYVIWGMPFFLMAGYVLHVFVAQALLLGPQLMFEASRPVGAGRPFRPISEGLVPVYVAIMLAVWAGTIGSFLAYLRQMLGMRQSTS